jgi:hypothetical protein
VTAKWRSEAAKFAASYDADTVANQYWKPVLDSFELAPNKFNEPIATTPRPDGGMEEQLWVDQTAQIIRTDMDDDDTISVRSPSEDRVAHERARIEQLHPKHEEILAWPRTGLKIERALYGPLTDASFGGGSYEA